MLRNCRQHTKALYAAAAAIMLSGFAPITVAAEQPLQPVPIGLKAANVLPEAMRAGEGYSVKDTVSNDGFQNTYTLESDYGSYTVTGNGGMVMSVGADVATDGTMVGTAVTVTSMAGMKEILKDQPPDTLTRINRKKLEKMGIEKVDIDALLKNYNYTPAEMTLMVEALNRMGNIKGRDIFVTHATAAPDRVIARYMQQYAEMLANYTTGKEPGDIVTIGNDVWLKTRSGKLVGAFPIDYLAWTAEVEGAEREVSADSATQGVKGKGINISFEQETPWDMAMAQGRCFRQPPQRLRHFPGRWCGVYQPLRFQPRLDRPGAGLGTAR